MAAGRQKEQRVLVGVDAEPHIYVREMTKVLAAEWGDVEVAVLERFGYDPKGSVEHRHEVADNMFETLCDAYPSDPDTGELQHVWFGYNSEYGAIGFWRF